MQTIEFNGWDIEILDLMNDGTDEQREKAEWVAEYLEPMMKASEKGITSVQYLLCKGFELIQVCYDNKDWLYDTVNVTADSVSGIAYDVVKHIF